eukprot:COSAG06_NODE_56_length_27627_cov_106.527136_12_plen_69_part_00
MLPHVSGFGAIVSRAPPVPGARQLRATIAGRSAVRPGATTKASNCDEARHPDILRPVRSEGRKGAFWG